MLGIQVVFFVWSRSFVQLEKKELKGQKSKHGERLGRTRKERDGRLCGVSAHFFPVNVFALEW